MLLIEGPIGLIKAIFGLKTSQHQNHQTVFSLVLLVILCIFNLFRFLKTKLVSSLKNPSVQCDTQSFAKTWKTHNSWLSSLLTFKGYFWRCHLPGFPNIIISNQFLVWIFWYYSTFLLVLSFWKKNWLKSFKNPSVPRDFQCKILDKYVITLD